MFSTYHEPIDRESAHELLARKMADIPNDEPIEKHKPENKEEGMLGKVVDVIDSPLGRAIGKEVVRGVFGLLGATPTRRRRRSGLW